MKPDAYTIELMKTAAEAITNVTGLRPHYVVNNLARKFLDTNRNLSEAAQGDRTAERIYNLFHGSIEDAKARVGRGILVDIHGYSTHPHGLIELGYLVSPSDLDSGDINPSKTSLSCVAETANILTHP